MCCGTFCIAFSAGFPGPLKSSAPFSSLRLGWSEDEALSPDTVMAGGLCRRLVGRETSACRRRAFRSCRSCTPVGGRDRRLGRLSSAFTVTRKVAAGWL